MFEWIHRNPGHWDIQGPSGRIAIRGGPHDQLDHFFIRDERKSRADVAMIFWDFGSAAAWVNAALVAEVEALNE